MDHDERDAYVAPELHSRAAAPGARVDPLGRELIPNAPLPRQPWWQALLALVGIGAALVFILVFAQALLDNISVLNGGEAPFVNTGVALMGILLSLALLIGYARWFRQRGSLTQLVSLLIVTFTPVALHYF